MKEGNFLNDRKDFVYVWKGENFWKILTKLYIKSRF